ncbi:hypothetical protein M5K25_007069 [Dendrobium thyrsiflorum]|uniref:Uncharacterized protein n=1 Tax=Dendrobium thyrsiflorum TaxID=117978 RepID=A0ABD0VCY5_DENTH
MSIGIGIEGCESTHERFEVTYNRRRVRDRELGKTTRQEGFGFGLLSTARDLESCSSSRIEEHCIFLCFIASTSGIQSFGVIFLKFPLSFYCFSSVFGCFPAVNSSFRIGSLRFWVGNA